ncbi:hypothetical protein M1271_04425 [Patescibacteria group bacterium]|nr:hypothetical protein [Patescibacteria group bacterium]
MAQAREMLPAEHEPPAENVVRVMPLQQISPNELRGQLSFNWSDVLSQKANPPNPSQTWLTKSYWVIKSISSEEQGQTMLPGKHLPKPYEFSRDDLLETAAISVCEKLHDYTITPNDIRIIQNQREYSFNHGNGRQTHRESLTITELPASFKPLSINPQDKIDDTVALSPLQVRYLLERGTVTVSDKKGAQRIITIVDSMRPGAARQRAGVVANQQMMDNYNLAVIKQAEKYEAQVRRDILIDLLTNSDHPKYGRKKSSRWKRERLEFLRKLDLENPEHVAAMIGKFNPLSRSYTFPDDDSLTYQQMLATFQKNFEPQEHDKSKELLAKMVDYDTNVAHQRLSKTRTDNHLELTRRYYLDWEMAKSMQRMAIRSDVSAVAEAGPQEPYMTADFIPALGILGPQEWQELISRHVKSEGVDTGETGRLNHHLIQIYEVLFRTFNINPTEENFGIKLIQALEHTRRLRANTESLDGKETLELEEIRQRLQQNFQLVMGITEDIFSRLSFDINTFMREIEEEALSFFTGSRGEATRFNLSDEVKTTRLLDLILLMHNMHPNRSLLPSGEPNPFRKNISASKQSQELPWTSRAKLLLMMDLFDSNKEWFLKMKTHTDELDKIIESMRSEDEEGIKGKDYYYEITEWDTNNPKLNLYPVDNPPIGSKPEAVMKKIKLDLTVDGKPVYIFTTDRDKHPLQRLRKFLTLDPSSPGIEDEFARYIIVWTEPPAGGAIGGFLFDRSLKEWQEKAILAIEKRMQEISESRLNQVYIKERRKPVAGIQKKAKRGRSAASVRLASLKFYEKVAVSRNKRSETHRLSSQDRKTIREKMIRQAPNVEVNIDGNIFVASPLEEIQFGDLDYYAWKMVQDPLYFRGRLIKVRPASGRNSFILLLNPRGKVVSDDLYKRVALQTFSQNDIAALS